MEPQRAPAAPGALARLSSHLDWYWTLSPLGRVAFWATFGGWAFDAYNQMTVGFVLPAVTAAFALSTTQAGLLGTVGLVTSAVGGAMVGALADAVGRVRVLILSIGSYALFALLAGCAQSYEQLLVFLTLQGLGFGGEWAAGAVLVAEYAQATQRGRIPAVSITPRRRLTTIAAGARLDGRPRHWLWRDTKRRTCRGAAAERLTIAALDRLW
jgi:MFS family permease